MARIRAAEREARPTLKALAKKYKTDKWGRHHYTPVYESHLAFLRDKRFALFEIGIGGYTRHLDGGASLRMWKDYFPRAQVVGLDIEDKSFVDEDRIVTVQGSQVDTDLLDTIMERYQPRVVIDDGSHRSEHVIETFHHLFPLLPAKGIYIVEDTHTSYWEGYGGTTDPSAPTTMNFVKGLLDSLNYEEFTPPGYEPTYVERHVVGVHAYHNMVVIQKGTNVEQGDKRRWRYPSLAAEERAAREARGTTAGDAS